MKETNKPPTILFFHPYRVGPWQEKLEMDAVYRFARARHWKIKEFNAPKTATSLKCLIQLWHPAGCIVCSSIPTKLWLGCFARIPSVFLDFDDNVFGKRAFRVIHDPASVAMLAAEHLMAFGLEHFAYIGYTNKVRWSEARLTALQKYLKGRATSFSSFSALPTRQTPSAKVLTRFAHWLAELPKPCGILIAHDYLSQVVYPVCKQLGLSIPKDVALIGVDDIERLCNNQEPKLSSIRLDRDKSGWMLAELLDAQLSNPSLRPQTRTYSAICVVPRESTALPRNRTDPLVEKILRRIREKAFAPITVGELTEDVGCTRRNVEIRFRAMTGQTIKEMLQDLRFKHACELLKEPDRPIGTIASLCGYRNDVHMKQLFKRRTGLSMRDWRKRNPDAERL